MINYVLRAVCLMVYLIAIIGPAAPVPPAMVVPCQWLALALLAAHVGELLLFFPRMRRYQGPLAVSIALTLLFGLLHWAALPTRD
ncbi:MAG: hypothetical protein V4508_22550 [Pseudomonadota bacterium]